MLSIYEKLWYRLAKWSLYLCTSDSSWAMRFWSAFVATALGAGTGAGASATDSEGIEATGVWPWLNIFKLGLK